MNAHWSAVTLADIFEIARGGSPRPIEQYITDSPDGLNWVKIGDATEGDGKFIGRTREKIRPEGLSKTRRVRAGDFLLTNSMSFGRPYIMATDGCIHDGWLLLRPRNENLVDRDYFYHLLSSDFMFAQFSARAAGSTVKNLNTEIVSSVQVKLPPLDEQRRIAAILDKADALRQKRKRSIALLDSLTSARASTSSTSADPSVGIEDVADLQVGYPFKSDGYTSDEDAVRLCRGANVLPGTLDWSDLAKWPTSRTQQYAHFALQSGDIIVAMDRPWIGAGFKIAQVQPKDLPALLVQRVARVRAKNARDAAYLFSILRGTDFTKHCKPTETTIPHISPKDFRSFRFGWPRDAVRENLANQTDAENKAREGMQANSSMLEAMFTSLQHRAFSGQL